MKRLKLSVVSLLTALVFMSGSAVLYADNLADLQKERTAISAQRASALEALKKAKDEHNDLLAEIIEMDIDLEDLSDELDFISERLGLTAESLARAEEELAAAGIHKDEQMELFIERLRVMDEKGSMSYLQILLNSKNVMDFIDRLENIKTIAEYDQALYADLEQTEEYIAAKVSEIEGKKQEIELLLAQETEKKLALESKIEEKWARIAYLEADETTWQQKLNELEKSSDAIDADIQKLEKEAAARKAATQKAQADSTSKELADKINQQKYSGGKLAWPLPGYYTISSPFGQRTSPRKEFHSGIDLPAPRGTNIVAAEKGVVTSSGWMNGYGYAVIINHGGGTSTLYGHTSKLLVSQGDEVSRGQVIALVGSTGDSTGNHVHFEVRVNGSKIDPMKYLK